MSNGTMFLIDDREMVYHTASGIWFKGTIIEAHAIGIVIKLPDARIVKLPIAHIVAVEQPEEPDPAPERGVL